MAGGAMNVSKTVWFHGSSEVLTSIKAGSSITPTENVARGFSYRPEFLSINNEGRRIRHNGRRSGYLYVVDEMLVDADVTIHPASKDDEWFEWRVSRDVLVKLVKRTEIVEEERFTKEEIAQMREKQKQHSGKSFVEKREE